MAGRCYQPGRGDDFIVLKLLAADGEIDWYDLAGGEDLRDDRAWSIVVGPDDHPVVSGLVVNADDTADFWTIKYDQNGGGFIWDVQLSGAVNNSTPAGWLAVLDDGDVILANRTWSPTTNYDVLLYRFASADGAIVWDKRFGRPGALADDPRAMILDRTGHPVVVGVSGSDFLTVKFDAASGDTLWTATYDGPPGWYDVATCVAVAPQGEVIVSGFSSGASTGWDVATVGYAADDGDRLWVLRHDGEGETDEARALAVSAFGDLYVTGYTYSLTTNMDMLSIRYTMDTAAEIPRATHLALAFTASPNPFNPRVTFAFSLPEAGPTRLAVFDLRGRPVASLFSGDLDAGNHALSWEGLDARGRSAPAGVYLVRLEGSGQIANRKIVLAK